MADPYLILPEVRQSKLVDLMRSGQDALRIIDDLRQQEGEDPFDAAARMASIRKARESDPNYEDRSFFKSIAGIDPNYVPGNRLSTNVIDARQIGRVLAPFIPPGPYIDNSDGRSERLR